MRPSIGWLLFAGLFILLAGVLMQPLFGIGTFYGMYKAGKEYRIERQEEK